MDDIKCTINKLFSQIRTGRNRSIEPIVFHLLRSHHAMTFTTDRNRDVYYALCHGWIVTPVTKTRSFLEIGSTRSTSSTSKALPAHATWSSSERLIFKSICFDRHRDVSWSQLSADSFIRCRYLVLWVGSIISTISATPAGSTIQNCVCGLTFHQLFFPAAITESTCHNIGTPPVDPQRSSLRWRQPHIRFSQWSASSLKHRLQAPAVAMWDR